ncbi:fimbrial protein [Pantoea sp. SO10]|nr:fimbrial protein [Pantoea sp. SO10]
MFGYGISVKTALALVVTFQFISLPIQAQTAATDITISGQLFYPQPCIFNVDPIHVDFGDNLLHNDIHGSRYEQPIDAQLDCSAAPVDSLKLRFTGIGASFDQDVLDTNHTDLGIELRAQGTKLPLNSWLPFVGVPPAMSAVPVKRVDSELKPGAFNAVATLEIDYQ